MVEKDKQVIDFFCSFHHLISLSCFILIWLLHDWHNLLIMLKLHQRLRLSAERRWKRRLHRGCTPNREQPTSADLTSHIRAEYAPWRWCRTVDHAHWTTFQPNCNWSGPCVVSGDVRVSFCMFYCSPRCHLLMLPYLTVNHSGGPRRAPNHFGQCRNGRAAAIQKRAKTHLDQRAWSYPPWHGHVKDWKVRHDHMEHYARQCHNCASLLLYSLLLQNIRD